MSASLPIYERLTVVGCGLIGSSVVRAAREAGAAGHITVADASQTVLDRVRELGIADAVEADLGKALETADLVIFATAVLAMADVMAAVAPHLKAGATVSDVGSVKGSVSEAMQATAPAGVHVIPGHPIAGTEQSGPDAGFAELFQDRWTILTPIAARHDDAYALAVARLASFWRAIMNE